MLLALVNSLLDLQQIKANKFKLQLSAVNIFDLLEEVKALFEYQCSKKNIQLDLNIDPDIPIMVVNDKNRLIQILINLVGNAEKFTTKGSITIGAERYEPDKIKLFVQDTGTGIKQEDKKRLFSVFGKLEETESINKQGIGLGLTICKHILEQIHPHNKIDVDSTYGKGTTFSF
mmetsp:Transcript_17334/g.15250  ORF Transcript_17334/g.15250 Transcript_17334/m.15250 type:complete len:174 (+) Transcript_17334:805-1326(+)